MVTIRLITALIMLGLCAASPAKTRYVEKWGVNSNDCASKNSPCRTVGYARNQAGKNDRIIVGPGIYTENILINTGAAAAALTGLRLESTQGRNATVLQALSTASHVLEIRQDGVRIGRRGRGFTIRNATSTTALLFNADTVRIEGNRLTSNGGGITTEFNGSKAQVRYNDIDNNSGNGFTCYGCDKAMITDNRIMQNGLLGVHLGLGGDDSQIRRNLIRDNGRSGISVDFFSLSVTVRDNALFKNGTVSDTGGIVMEEVAGSTVQGNISTGGSTFGLNVLQFEPGNFSAIDNLMVGNDYGIRANGVQGSRLERNSLIQSSFDGFYLASGSNFTRFRNNNSIDSSNCGIRNNAAAPLNYLKQFFDEFIPTCGSGGGFVTTSGSLVTKPNKVNVNRARKL